MPRDNDLNRAVVRGEYEAHWAVVGNLLMLKVRDLALYTTRQEPDDEMPPTTMDTYGKLIQVREDYVVIAYQSFADGGVRQSLSVPVHNILTAAVLHAGEAQEV